MNLNDFKNSDFWQKVVKDATLKASRTEDWKKFDDPSKYFVLGAKEHTRAVFVEWALDDLTRVYSMDMTYLDLQKLSESMEVEYLLELKKRIEKKPEIYAKWLKGSE